MNTTSKTKTELIDSLKRERSFTVQAIHTGPASQVAKELTKLGSKQVSVIITESK